jgi:hypothetical protein
LEGLEFDCVIILSAYSHHNFKIALAISDNLGLELVFHVALGIPCKFGDKLNGLGEIGDSYVVVEV